MSKKTSKDFFLTNKLVLIFIFLVALGCIVTYAMMRNVVAIVIFCLIGFVTSFFSKNMIIVLLIPIVLTAIITGFYDVKHMKEGFTEEDQDDEEMNKNAEEEEEEEEKYVEEEENTEDEETTATDKEKTTDTTDKEKTTDTTYKKKTTDITDKKKTTDIIDKEKIKNEMNKKLFPTTPTQQIINKYN
jgi:cytoskeletal protein RodZ